MRKKALIPISVTYSQNSPFQNNTTYIPANEVTGAKNVEQNLQVVHKNILLNGNSSCSEHDVEYIKMETCQSCFGQNAKKIKEGFHSLFGK